MNSLSGRQCPNIRNGLNATHKQCASRIRFISTSHLTSHITPYAATLILVLLHLTHSPVLVCSPPLPALAPLPHTSISCPTRAMAVVHAGAVTGKGTKRKVGSQADVDSRLLKRNGSARQTAPEDESATAAEGESRQSADGESVDGSESIVSIPTIRRYEKEAIASRQRLNHVTALLAHIEQQQQQQDAPSAASAASLHTTTAAYQSLYRIFEHYAEAGELPLAGGTAGASATLAGQLRAWLHSQYTRYVACSLSFIGHRHGPLQLSALHAVMALVRLSAAPLQPDTAASRLTTGLYASMLRAALASPHYGAIHDALTCEYLLPHADLRVVALRAVKANMQLAVRPVELASDSETALHNTLTLLLDLSKPASA